MPTYVYRREDGSTFEVQQRITEDALETCPDTGQKVERIISGSAGLIFKGDGFYITDYARSGSNGSSSTEASSDTDSSSGTKDDAGSKDTKSTSSGDSSAKEAA